MAYIDDYRKEQLKNWQKLPDLWLPPETVAFYNQKIKASRVDIALPQSTIADEDDTGENIDHTYLKYLMLLCFNDYVLYTESKGVILKNDKINIGNILNEIINNEFPESYYTETIMFYRNLFGWIHCKYYDYGLMDQAIKFNNQRMIHYLIFRKQENLEKWFKEVTNPPPNDEEDELEIPPIIETGFASDNCIICCVGKPNILNFPCLHISHCESCEEKGRFINCSICRKKIQRKVKI